MNKITKNIVIFVCIFALLAVGFLWLFLSEPAKDGQNSGGNVPNAEAVYKKNGDEVESITLNTSDGELIFTKAGDEWRIGNAGTDKLEKQKINSFVQSALNIYSLERVEESDEACGLDNPTATIKIKDTGGATDTISIGGKSAVTDKVFFRVNDGDVWTMSATTAENLTENLEYYRSYKRFAIDKSEIYDVTVSRDKNTYHLEKNGDTWLIKSPFKKEYHINYDFLNDDILTPISEIELSTPVENAELISTSSTYKPAVVTVLSADEQSDGTRGETNRHILYIGRTEASKVYVEYDGEVFLVDKQMFDFVDVNEMYILSKYLAITDISTVNEVKIEKGNDTFSLKVAHTAIGAKDDEMSFEANGRSVGSDEAKKLYREIISLAADDRYNGQRTDGKLATIQFDTVDGKKKIEFFAIDEYISTFTVNGSTEFVIKKSSIDTLMQSVEGFFAE